MKPKGEESKSKSRTRKPKSQVLQPLNIDKCLKKLQTLWLSGDQNLRELICTVSREGPLEPEVFGPHLQRLRAGRIPGFEGAKLLNIKLNKKLKAAGEQPIDLPADDLRQRQIDQYSLYKEICKSYQSAQPQPQPDRLANVKYVKFVVPQPEQKRVRVCLQEAIPFLVAPSHKEPQSAKLKRDLYWDQLR